MNKAVIVLLCAVLISCATGKTLEGTYVSPDKHIEDGLISENKSELRIYRIDALMQSMVGVNVFLNEEKVATINNSSVTSIKIMPGKHAIYSKMGGLDANSGCGFDFEIEKGEVMYMSLSPNASGALPIISILINPMVCKFELLPVVKTEGEMKFVEIQSSKT